MKARALGVGWIFMAWLVFACWARAADLVDLNTAREDAIAQLPGVGPELARQIVGHRLYGSMAELSKAGLSPDQIKQLSSVATVKPVQNEPPGGIGGNISQTTGAPGPLFRASYNPGEKKRVAVLNFEYAAVPPSVQRTFGSNVDIGKGVANKLVDRLESDGTYSIIAPQARDKILAEQNLSNSSRADANAAAHIGKLLGVDAIIIGSVTASDDKSGGGVGNGGLFGHIGKPKSKAVVEVTARMIDVHTGEILAFAEGRGESKVGSEATNASVTDLAAKLDQAAGSIPPPATVAGLVADVNGDKLVLNVGGSKGLKVGDVLRVVRLDREIKDPSTGKVLRRVETDLGKVTITSVDNLSSEGAYSGAAGVRVGDQVKQN
ncbi:MAG TPA: CsgG/HfaB family protein [Bryobacteraceae bacterium]|nr:CsgG/HfaB family protein [Bryobacteraceae bacterium]